MSLPTETFNFFLDFNGVTQVSVVYWNWCTVVALRGRGRNGCPASLSEKG